ncbi:MAG: DegT/DnrJ/EryC1/StrS family aminotransferase [Bryobacterales bacterium]|nr:DegT/DnrJ/EryC1/StrS family aminotransferase [Bryobacterales bacterium]
MDRRKFVAASVTASAAAGLSATPALAAEGGAPVRTEPLNAGYWGTQFYGEEEREQLMNVLETRRPFRWYGTGRQAPDKVATFEKEFAARMGAKYALAVTSGTAALQCAMAALEVGPGDEVVLPAWTWHSCYAAIVLAGALPVFAEIDESFDIDPDDLDRKITPRTKAVMAVHLQGMPANMDRVLEVARRRKVKVLEDCAQSVGGSYKGKPLGSMGDIGIYSLQLNKSITAGEGGAVVTSDPLLLERASRFHDVGGFRAPHEQWVGKPQLSPFVGTNFRMNEFSGGVLLAQLRKLDKIVGGVRANAARVYAGIADLPGLKTRLRNDVEGDIGTAVFAGFASQRQRDKFMELMRAENVPARPPSGSVILPVQPYIEGKATVHPAWPSFTSTRGKAIRYGAEACPRTLDILSRFAGVAMDPKFTRRDTDDVIAAFRKVHGAALKA